MIDIRKRLHIDLDEYENYRAKQMNALQVPMTFGQWLLKRQEAKTLKGCMKDVAA